MSLWALQSGDSSVRLFFEGIPRREAPPIRAIWALKYRAQPRSSEAKTNVDEDAEADHQARANMHGLSLDLRRRRFKGRRTLAPESLFTGEHLRAMLMTILCDRYLSCRVPAAACIPPSATRIFSLAPIQAARNRQKPHSSSSGELRN
jgi:hypothetical protein